MKKMLILCSFLTYAALCMEVPTQRKTNRRDKLKIVFFESSQSRYNSSNSNYALRISFDPQSKTIIGNFISWNPKKIGISYIVTLEKKLGEEEISEKPVYKGINVTDEETPSRHKVKLLTDKMFAFEKTTGR